MLRLFLCGDVMIGRGVDQILPDPCPPELHEDFISSAADYVALAERASGPIRTPVNLSYVWGAALEALREKQPDAGVINLETSVTSSEAYEPKGVNYRVSKKNARCLQSLGRLCCSLANNHVLDWGRTGLIDTLDALREMKIQTAGAGRDVAEARRPAVLHIAGKGRVVVFSVALPSSGAPLRWAATSAVAGVSVLPDLSDESLALACDAIDAVRKPGDIVVLSVHWGPNWGYEISAAQRRFAHRAIDAAGVSIVHGHSSHHAKGLEVYKNRLILYGCGDFLNDYEGITGYEEYRGDLSALYFVDVERNRGEVAALEIAPLQIRRIRLERASDADADWLARRLDRESAPFGLHVTRNASGMLVVSWA